MKKPWLLACLLAACNGTETGNPPVIDFGNSGCHGSSIDKDVHLQSLDELAPDPRFAGLSCMLWDHPQEDQLRVRMTNYAAGCGSDTGWQPVVELRDDGSLDLILQDEDCSVARCGSCLYELSFTVELSSSAPDTEVRVYQRGCAESGVRRALLPLRTQSSGAACDYTGGGFYRGGNASPAGEHLLCGSEQAITCNPTLTCSEVGEQNSRCLRACQTDADCDSLDRCAGAVCKLGATGLRSEEAPK